jgi:Holliday junction resolvasome RuvABC endonuclease subunit
LETDIHYLTDNKKLTGSFGNITGHFHEEWRSPEERYENIATWVLNGKLTPNDKVYIEDYSFGSTGRVFHIAENMGQLKYQLYRAGIKFETIPPTVIKKYFFGKGNADKDKMYEAFLSKTNIDLYQTLGKSRGKKVISPISDIVDAYAIACYGHKALSENQTH